MTEMLTIETSMERPRTKDPTECKHDFRHLDGRDIPRLNAFGYSRSFTILQDIQKERPLETNKPLFRVAEPNIYHCGCV